MPTPPPRIPKPTPPKAPKALAKKTAPAEPTRKFGVSPWTGADEGEKFLLYGKTGLGKTTLASTMPNPIFIGLDDGGRKIRNPKTQEPINHIPGVESYEDVRMVLHQHSLFPGGSTCVIDTATFLEVMAGDHVLQTVSLPKEKGVASNLKAYGWNEGSSHVLDAFRLVLQDCDALVRQGVNICLICQEQAIVMPNPGGLDFLRACPKLHHDRQYSIMGQVCEWADHIFRIDYLNTVVRAAGDAAVGKISTGSGMTRAVYVTGAPDYEAKCRTLGKFISDEDDAIECVAFDNPADDSLWTFIFGEAN